MAAVPLVAVFYVRVITGVHSVMERLVRVRIVKWVHTVIAVSCVPIMFRDRSAIAVNLDTGGCQTTAVEVCLQKKIIPSTHLSPASIHTPSGQAEFRIWLAELIRSFSNDGGDGNGKENVKAEAVGLTTALCVHYTFWYISLPSLHD